MRLNALLPALAMIAITAACGGTTQPMPGDVPVFDGIGKDEEIRLIGTEPFWGVTIEGATLTYTTPENPAGTQATVERFAGNGGLGYSGKLDGQALVVAITPGECSDGMSDRSYPFTAAVTLGEAKLFGCAWSSNKPYKGVE